MSESSRTGGWVVAGIGLLAGGLSVLGAFGAFIPPLGALFGTEGEGAGTFFGLLLGACFWGGIGLLALKLTRADQRKQLAVVTANAPFTPSSPVVPLPAGLGMRWRWAMTVPVMLLAVVGPWTGSVLVSLWWRRDVFSMLHEDEPFWGEFAESVGDAWPAVLVPVLTIAVYVLLRGGTIATWPKACVILALLLIGPTALMTLVAQERIVQNLPAILFCAGLVWAAWEFGRAAVGLLTRPIAMDVVRSSAEIPVPLPEGVARLRVQRTEVVLDKVSGHDKKKRLTLSLTKLRSVGMTEVAEPTKAHLPSSITLDLPAGSALRLASGKSEWLLPIEEITGQYLVAAITDRASRLRKS
jgi:hypothetical protein